MARCLPGSVYVYQGEELGLEDAPPATDIQPHAGPGPRGCGFACVVNCSEQEITSPIGGYAMTASDASVRRERNIVTLPPDTGAWVQAWRLPCQERRSWSPSLSKM